METKSATTEVPEGHTVREAGKNDFTATEKDLLETIDEMTRAKVTTKKVTSFLQVREWELPSKKLSRFVFLIRGLNITDGSGRFGIIGCSRTSTQGLARVAPRPRARLRTTWSW